MASSPSGSRLFALIIGIDDYTPETGFIKLKGAVRDADNIRNWLVKDFNVPPSHIQHLRDNAATRKAIVEALEGLSTDPKIKRDDPILIYYAGHGTQARPPKQWCWDSPNIQMIVPWNFKQSDTDGSDRIIHGIPDRTLSVLLTKLAKKKGNNITVILDCCHSGSGTRSDSDTRIRGGPCEGEIPANLDEDLKPADLGEDPELPRTRGAQVKPKFEHHGLRSHVLLAACAPHEFAHENGSSGAFTVALLKALNGVNTAELTYEGLMERMDKLQTQTPQCEGHYRDRFLFDRKVANTNPILDVTLRNEKLTITGAGAIHGISVGSKFAIWKSRSDLKADPLATVTVEVVKAHESIATFKKKVGSRSLVAQIKENPKPTLFIYVPEVIQNMNCFKDLFLETEGRPPLSIAVTEDKVLANIGLTYFDKHREIGFEMLKSEEQDQKIRHTIDPTAEDLYGALDHLCHYYYHRDRVSTQVIGQDHKVPFSSKFTVDVFTLEENDEEIYVPSGPNLNIQGTGVELTIGSHNAEEMYGFRITNNTEFPVFPYLFYFDSSNFSITPIYQPVAIAQDGAKERSIHSLPASSSLTVGYGSAGATPQNLAISDDKLDLEQGYLRLYVSTRHVDLSTLKKGAISEKTRGIKEMRPSTEPAMMWGAITVPVVLKRGEEPPSIRMIGIIGSQNNGKNTFLEELFRSLDGKQKIEPSFQSAFIKEYSIPLRGPDEETLILVDLPAFEDNNIDKHVSVLRAIVAYLGTQYQKRYRLSSLIWCYNISKPRFTVVDRENLNLVKDISGLNALKNVTVLTTNWNRGAGLVTNVAKSGTLAAGVSPLRRYEKGESQLKPLCEGVKEFKRFGTFSDPAARKTMSGSTSVEDPLELILSLMSNEEGEEFQVQREACETKKLVGTTAGRRLQGRFAAEIEKKEKEILGLDAELNDLAEHDPDRNALLEEKADAAQDIIRWRVTLKDIELWKLLYF
ncbi:hypothetical protein EST38_g7376 [Candolleomyces aberdarensis]|uniref:Peptidase C14 caspase domain-containing protein n=1 Tax=Candolleomyces aberdarensis TaxID=2316362 RepID=A0A4Q2DFA1_9AGAR|nr:hypothetical protein EST38_g7376 [Candolleomyces aberdarensis]